jgi:hypothetical protein
MAGATRISARPLPSKEMPIFPKNEHWRRRTLEYSIPCETKLQVFELAHLRPFMGMFKLSVFQYRNATSILVSERE